MKMMKTLMYRHLSGNGPAGNSFYAQKINARR